ncbi:MAG: hypothetical protein K2Y22_14330 [Candidatus Obscuribacterales bacterium]|nr:hypothetical protein [Candidatus Obscuribacterales bacterium]
MTIIAFAFAFVSLVIMCAAFLERMGREQTKTSNTDEVLTSEQQFHALVEKVNSLIGIGVFGVARDTCLKALEALSAARLNKKSDSDALFEDLKKLTAYIHELDYEAEVLPLYREVKANLKNTFTGKHKITWLAKTQLKQLELSANIEQSWLGRNINELLPMLMGEAAYDQCRQIAEWSKEMCSIPEPCYAVRQVAARR